MTNFNHQVALRNGVGLLDEDSLDLAGNRRGDDGFHLEVGDVQGELLHSKSLLDPWTYLHGRQDTQRVSGLDLSTFCDTDLDHNTSL
jgi:hypothetical protein